jgi:hypothetical protein
MQKIMRLEDLQLIVAQTIERLLQLRMYNIEAGDWLDADEVMTAIEDLRRAMGDCTLDEEGQR